MNENENSLITVVISTRNRGSHIVKTIESILLNDYSHFEIYLVDQNEDRLTENALHSYLNSPRFRYIKADSKGIATGRNLGIEKANGELIALTDDDCEVAKNWLQELAKAFSIDQRIGVVFTNVLAGAHDRALGFIAAYVRNSAFLGRSMREKHCAEGIGAGMALRRSLWRKLGGFDVMLGAGAPFRSGEDLDFSMRSLQSGYWVYEIPQTHVVHTGFRTWKEGHAIVYDYLYGIGATFAKHLNCNRLSVVTPLCHLFWRWAFRGPVVDLGRRPPKGLRLGAFIKGLMAGAAHPVDKQRGHFIKSSYSAITRT
jgi:GT2 family glycosyltransferase